MRALGSLLGFALGCWFWLKLAGPFELWLGDTHLFFSDGSIAQAPVTGRPARSAWPTLIGLACSVCLLVIARR